MRTHLGTRVTSIKVKSLLDPRESAISGHILMEIAPYGPLIHEKKDERFFCVASGLRDCPNKGRKALPCFLLGLGESIPVGWNGPEQTHSLMFKFPRQKWMGLEHAPKLQEA